MKATKVSFKKTRREKTRRVLERAIPVESLPPLVSKALACDFSLLTPRTFDRAVEKGLLTPVKRNSRTVSYHRDELLAFLGFAVARPRK
jgi:hypothetical protein